MMLYLETRGVMAGSLPLRKVGSHESCRKLGSPNVPWKRVGLDLLSPVIDSCIFALLHHVDVVDAR